MRDEANVVELNESEYASALEDCDDALGGYESGLDELGEACDASETDQIEHAVRTIDSATEKLFDATRRLEEARHALDHKPDDELVGIRLHAVAGNKRLTEEASREVESILEETPSDGEQVEEQLEKLVTVANALYESLEEVL